jgi:hypothetical protein
VVGVNELPNWIYDVVMDLLDEEDTHKAYQVEAFNIATGRHELMRHDWCPAKPLRLVPDEVKAAARVIAQYRRGLEVPSDLSRATDPTSTERTAP